MAGIHDVLRICDKCSAHFYSQVNLEKHKSDVHGDYFKCNLCNNRKFRMESALISHGSARHEYLCQPCLLFFDVHLEYKRHNDNPHKFPCRICNSIFKTRSALNNHLNTPSHQINLKNHHTSVNTPQPLPKPVSQQSPTKARQQAPLQKATPKQIAADPYRAIVESHVSLESHNAAADTFKCDECNAEFNNVAALQKHQMKEHWIKCKCGNKLRDQAALERHKRQYHAFACNKCEIKLETFADFKIHIELMHEFKCGKCPAVFSSQHHNSSHHLECHSLSCEKCQKLFDTSTALLQHMNENHQFQCGNSECNSGAFAGLAALALHEIAAHAIRCKHCQTILPSQAALHEHIVENHYFQCWECGHSGFFADPEALALHEMAVHTLRCKQCQATFSNQTVLDKHIKENHYFKCDNCSYSGLFADLTVLSLHKKATHTIACNHCQAKFSDLDEPMNADHQFQFGKRNSEHFTDPAALLVHVATDANRCKECQRTFSSQTVVEEHVRMSHVMSCPGCPGSTFDSEKSLDQHFTAVHSICCTKCPKIFEDVSLLLEHFSQEHCTQTSSAGDGDGKSELRLTHYEPPTPLSESTADFHRDLYSLLD